MLHQAPTTHVQSEGGEPSQGQSLVEAAREGRADAWNELYVRLYPRLLAYVARRCGREAAEDLVSETMTRAVGSIARFRWEAAGFNGWVFGIARNVTADHHRRAERVRRRGTRAEGRPSEHEMPGEGIELAAEHEAVRRAFERLSEADRELLELRVIAGLSADEVAVAVGKRPGAVRMAQSRALARLRELLEDEG